MIVLTLYSSWAATWCLYSWQFSSHHTSLWAGANWWEQLDINYELKRPNYFHFELSVRTIILIFWHYCCLFVVKRLFKIQSTSVPTSTNFVYFQVYFKNVSKSSTVKIVINQGWSEDFNDLSFQFLEDIWLIFCWYNFNNNRNVFISRLPWAYHIVPLTNRAAATENPVLMRDWNFLGHPVTVRTRRHQILTAWAPPVPLTWSQQVILRACPLMIISLICWWTRAISLI